MKAAVLKVRNGEAMVLLQDGTMKKIKYNGRRGDEIELPLEADKKIPARREGKVLPFRRLAQTAAAAVLVLALTTGAWTYMSVQACSFVTVDVNPSIEYILNRRNEVLSVEALNIDARVVAEALMAMGVQDLPFADALAMTEEILDEQGYLGSDEEEMLISIVTDTDDRYEKLSEEAIEVTAKHKSMGMKIGPATPDDRKAAKKEGVSTGKYLHEHRPSEMKSYKPGEKKPRTENEPPPEKEPSQKPENSDHQTLPQKPGQEPEKKE